MFLDDEVRASVETAKAASDPGIWQEAWAAGSAMSLDEAADDAQLGEPSRSPPLPGPDEQAPPR
jgi:hypothetical protein